MKKCIVFALIMACSLSLTACFPMGGVSPTPDASPAPPDHSLDMPETRVDAFFKKVKDAGLEVDGKIEKSPQMIGAVQGKAYRVNGVVVEAYEYDASALTDSTKKYYESAKNDGVITVAEGGAASPVIFYGDMALFCDGHPDAEVLKELFEQE